MHARYSRLAHSEGRFAWPIAQLTPRRPRSEPQVLIFGLADLRTGAESQRYTRMS